MFGNIKKLLAEKKKEKFLQEKKKKKYLQKIIADSIYDQSEIKAAFANEQEMSEVFSEIYAHYLDWVDFESEYEDDIEDDIEDFICDCDSGFNSYVSLREDGYSRQYALYKVFNYNDSYKEARHYMRDELFLSDYYCDCKDTNVALKDINVYISKELCRINNPVFKKAYSNEVLQICTNKDYFDKALKFYAEGTVLFKYERLEYAFSSTIPPRMELEELSERLNRMDDNAKSKANNRYRPKFWKYLAHIAASKLEINVSDEYKDVVALTILLGLGCDDFIYVDNAVEYVESTLPFFELSVPAKDVEKLCYLAAERCKKEVEMYIDLRRQCWSPVEEMVKLVTEFGIIE